MLPFTCSCPSGEVVPIPKPVASNLIFSLPASKNFINPPSASRDILLLASTIKSLAEVIVKLPEAFKISPPCTVTSPAKVAFCELSKVNAVALEPAEPVSNIA